MSETVEATDAGSNVDVSSDPVSTEIGSGALEAEVKAESSLNEPISGEHAQAIDDAAEAVEDAIADGASKEEVQELIETFKFKANGKEKEVTLDWNNKEDIIRRLQLAESAQPAMQKAAELEKMFGNEMDRLSTAPWEVLEELGIDVDELAEQRIQSRIDELQKSPEQLAKESQQQEITELRNRLQEQEDHATSAQVDQINLKAQQDLDVSLTRALDATTELPNAPFVVKRIANAMMVAVKNGYEDVTPEDVIPSVSQEINGELMSFFDSMSDEQFNKFMGKKNLDRSRVQRVNKIKTQTAASIRDSGNRQTSDNTPKKRISTRDFLKYGIAGKPE